MKKETTSKLVAFIFGIVFLAAGAATARQIITAASQAARLKHAAAVPAHIEDVSLISDAGTVKGGGAGAHVEARYNFEFNGQTYHSENLALLFSAPEELYQPLKMAKDSGGTVPCFVDPQDPALSTFIRELPSTGCTLLVLASFVFIGLGLAILVSTLSDLLRRNKPAPPRPMPPRSSIA